MPWETFWITWAGAAGVCEKYRTPLPTRPDPRQYPPAVLESTPPVRFGLSVDAKGARPGNCLMAVPTRVAAYLASVALGLATCVVYWREACVICRCVDSHLLVWRRTAAGWIGCLGVARTKTGIGCVATAVVAFDFAKVDADLVARLERKAVLVLISRQQLREYRGVLTGQYAAPWPPSS
jgi:hypothetical protein